MLEVGVAVIRVLKTESLCSRIFEVVRLKRGKALVVSLEVGHAENAGPMFCARSGVGVASRLSGVKLENLIFVERLQVIEEDSLLLESEAAFARVLLSQNSVSWERVKNTDWLELEKLGLGRKDLILLGDIDLEALHLALKVNAEYLAVVA